MCIVNSLGKVRDIRLVIGGKGQVSSSWDYGHNLELHDGCAAL